MLRCKETREKENQTTLTWARVEKIFFRTVACDQPRTAKPWRKRRPFKMESPVLTQPTTPQPAVRVSGGPSPPGALPVPPLDRLLSLCSLPRGLGSSPRLRDTRTSSGGTGPHTQQRPQRDQSGGARTAALAPWQRARRPGTLQNPHQVSPPPAPGPRDPPPRGGGRRAKQRRTVTATAAREPLGSGAKAGGGTGGTEGLRGHGRLHLPGGATLPRSPRRVCVCEFLSLCLDTNTLWGHVRGGHHHSPIGVLGSSPEPLSRSGGQLPGWARARHLLSPRGLLLLGGMSQGKCRLRRAGHLLRMRLAANSSVGRGGGVGMGGGVTASDSASRSGPSHIGCPLTCY